MSNYHHDAEDCLKEIGDRLTDLQELNERRFDAVQEYRAIAGRFRRQNKILKRALRRVGERVKIADVYLKLMKEES